jgi:hypothetical protein
LVIAYNLVLFTLSAGTNEQRITMIQDGRAPRHIVRAMRERQSDLKRAENLRKSSALANKRPGTGPRVAR